MTDALELVTERFEREAREALEAGEGDAQALWDRADALDARIGVEAAVAARLRLDAAILEG